MGQHVADGRAIGIIGWVSCSSLSPAIASSTSWRVYCSFASRASLVGRGGHGMILFGRRKRHFKKTDFYQDG